MNHTILLIEDEADTRELLARALERAGHACHTAASPSDAIALGAANASIDTVVADVILAGDDRGGLHVMQELRARGLHAPVVVITAHADLEMVKYALNEGAAHFLEKPFRTSELLEAIERAHAQPERARAMEALFTRTRLTEKERSVARHLAGGLSSNEIAAVERNSPKTIRQHVSQIYAKCGVSSRAEFLRLVYSG